VTSTAIAKIFGLHPKKGTIAPGADADIVIFDPNRQFTFSTETSLMNVDYDLFEGKTVAGSARTTLSRGTVVFDDGRILTQPGHGRFVKRSTFDPANQGNVPLGVPVAG
jgi:dihydropyrimidinase